MMMKRLSKYLTVLVIVALLISVVPLSSSTSFSVELIDPANPKHPFYEPYQYNTTSAPTIHTPVLRSGWQYYVSFSLGNPALQLLGAMDLASDLTWIQCQSCKPCAPLPDGAHDFEPQRSSTYNTVRCRFGPCKYSVKYADGSTSTGIISTDMLKLGNGMFRYPIQFGCGNANMGLSGVVGLGEGKLSIVGQLNGPRTFSYGLVPGSSVLTFGGPTVWGSRTLILPMRVHSLHTGIGLAVMQGVVEKACRGLMNFQESQT
ncbi:Protein ASPARTIC PROTEASE IN GUARD CELL 1 [Striga hermonthica]|uniref:Protein ASPARTIC PROTEASE IN GUARD CELL 1 n=1 Tax=Striga hermonthica TaxID=68872 RepID=A0A9N7NBV5_STRHE|nr:Protein ASPARTIC PROTEASE IN GUARD CELL 1 [Striga hermonthica]